MAKGKAQASKRSLSVDSGSSEESDREDVQKGAASLTKRRKTTSAFVPTFKQDLSEDDDDDEDEDEDEDEESDGEDGGLESDPIYSTEKAVSGASAEDQSNGLHPSRQRRNGKLDLKPLTPEELNALNEAKARTGVVYLSKIPPFMKPHKVKHLLSKYGEVGRIFLAPEDPKSYAKRVRFGGNKRRMFAEGWIEFLDKRKAKLVASTLNAEPIGGKKNGFYHDDIWNLKYLPKFKWEDLTAQIAAENASRQARLQVELQQAKREDRHYLQNAERAKMIEGMQKTREAKRPQGQVAAPEPEQRVRRLFNQRDPADKTKKQAIVQGQEASSEKLTKVLGSLF